jgi:proteasome lid subunit RPN8/RPN11
MQLMRLEVERHTPEEACGLLIGRKNGFNAMTVHTIPVTNILHSPTRFRLDGREQVEVFNQMEKEELELVGIYHSHPLGPPGPSEIDIKEAYYPEVVHLIWSRTEGAWSCAGYSIYEGHIIKAALILTNTA